MSFFSQDSSPAELDQPEQALEQDTVLEQDEGQDQQDGQLFGQQQEEDGQELGDQDQPSSEQDLEQSDEDQESDEQTDDDDNDDEQAQPESSEPQEALREWQSKYDKLKAEYDNYKHSIGSIPKEVVDLANDIQSNPKVLDAIEAAITGKPIAGQVAPDSPEAIKSQLDSLKRPQRPEKPEDSSDYEAIDKYERDLAKYNQDRLDYLESKDELQSKYDQALQAQQANQQQLERQKQELGTNLRTKFGFTESDVKGFMDMFNAQPELGDLVQLYKIKTGKLANSTKNKPQVKRKVPAPAVSASGSRPASSTKSNGFWSGNVR